MNVEFNRHKITYHKLTMVMSQRYKTIASHIYIYKNTNIYIYIYIYIYIFINMYICIGLLSKF